MWSKSSTIVSYLKLKETSPSSSLQKIKSNQIQHILDGTSKKLRLDPYLSATSVWLRRGSPIFRGVCNANPDSSELVTIPLISHFFWSIIKRRLCRTEANRKRNDHNLRNVWKIEAKRTCLIGRNPRFRLTCVKRERLKSGSEREGKETKILWNWFYRTKLPSPDDCRDCRPLCFFREKVASENTFTKRKTHPIAFFIVSHI